MTTSIDCILYIQNIKKKKEEEISLSDQSHLGGFLDGSTFSTKNDKAFDQISDAFLSLFIGGVNNEY